MNKMTIKIWCEVCKGKGFFNPIWPEIRYEDDKKCQGKDYREVTLDELIKIPDPFGLADDEKYRDHIKSRLNLELLK